MGETTTLTASDGHTLGAYISRPDGPAKGGIVVVQEIFGVNEHIRDVTDQYAGLGYAAIAPAFFDRVQRDVELGYDEPGFTRGRELIGEIGFEEPLLDLAAGVAAVADAGEVSTVGYCWGGAIVWLAASEVEGLSHVISYYGSRIAQFQDRAPKIPTMMHVGREDATFPMEVVEAVGAAYPDVKIHAYAAGHGFNCTARKDFNPIASDLALNRTLAFISGE